MSKATDPPVLHVKVSAQMFTMLELLRRTGLYGRSPEKAAERLICEGLKEVFGPTLMRKMLNPRRKPD